MLPQTLQQTDTELTKEASNHLNARNAFPVQREVIRSDLRRGYGFTVVCKRVHVAFQQKTLGTNEKAFIEDVDEVRG